MFPRKYNKQNKFLRLFLKLFNLYAYDKETLNIVNPNYKNDGKNIIKLNDKSFNHATGYLNLSRKVKNLDIYFRYAPSNNLWNSTSTWKRIITNIDKETLILVCLLSLKESLLYFMKNNHIEVSLHLIGDKTNPVFENKLDNILKNTNFKIFKYNNKVNGNRESYLKCCDLAEKAKDLIFFVEDDYLFERECIDEIINSFARISSLLKKDIIMCPSDYPFFYDSQYPTNLFIGKNYRWRLVGETLLTFLFSNKISNVYKKKNTSSW